MRDETQEAGYVTPDQPGGIPGWREDVPVFRIYTCGLFTIEMLVEVLEGDAAQARYVELPAERLSGRGPGSALKLVKILLSQEGRYATKDWLRTHLREGEEVIATNKRLENIISHLRCHLLTLPSGKKLSDLLVYIKGTSDSGDGYRLADYPLVWVDVDALVWNVKQACLKERFDEDPFEYWQRAYTLASRGTFLLEEANSDWATKRRETVEDQLRQSVRALVRLYLARFGQSAEEDVIRVLSAYRRMFPTDEDALRPLLQLLNQRHDYGIVLEYYEQLEVALEALGPTKDGKVRAPHPLTAEIADFARLKLREEQQALPPISARDIVQIPFPEAERPDPFPQLWNIPYQRNPFFTGREELLLRLHELLNEKKTVVAVAQYALCGLGGIGKTQTVLEYIYRYGSEYLAIFWVKADTRENLLADFLSLVQLLALPEQNAQDQAVTIAAIKRWLQEHVGWLLVFDNADDLEMVREVLPTRCQGHVLLTTRAQAMGRVAHRLEVEEMDLETGALFLLRRAGLIEPDVPLEKAPEKDRILAEGLVQELGGLPLALDQAGAYIEEASLSIEEYKDLYRRQKYVLLKRRGGLVTDHPEPVAMTWLLSFQRVQKMDSIAADMLRLCAFLDPDAIAEEIFTQGAAHVCVSLASLSADPTRLHRAIEVLRIFSLIRRNPETKILTIHRLVQESILGIMDQEAQQCWANLTIQAVSAIFPGEVTVACWSLCQRLLPHVQLCVMLVDTYHLVVPEAALLFNQAGYYLRERALYQEAESLYKKALAIRESLLGPSHLDTAQVLYNLARLYYDLGQYSLCETLHLQALEIREQGIPTDRLALALSLNSLAFLYYIQERKLDEAERLYRRALPLFEDTLGMDHPKTAHCLSNLALLYVSQGKDTEAEQLLLRVREIRERYLGPMHLDTARSLQNLAWFYVTQRKQERYAEAKQFLQRSLTIRETLLGPEHPQVAMSLHHLALWSEAQGDNAEAQHLYQQVLTIRRKMMGDDNPKVLLTEASYAALLRKMGMHEEAAQLEEHLQVARSRAETQSRLKNSER